MNQKGFQDKRSAAKEANHEKEFHQETIEIRQDLIDLTFQILRNSSNPAHQKKQIPSELERRIGSRSTLSDADKHSFLAKSNLTDVADLSSKDSDDRLLADDVDFLIESESGQELNDSGNLDLSVESKLNSEQSSEAQDLSNQSLQSDEEDYYESELSDTTETENEQTTNLEYYEEYETLNPSDSSTLNETELDFDSSEHTVDQPALESEIEGEYETSESGIDDEEISTKSLQVSETFFESSESVDSGMDHTSEELSDSLAPDTDDLFSDYTVKPEELDITILHSPEQHNLNDTFISREDQIYSAEPENQTELLIDTIEETYVSANDYEYLKDTTAFMPEEYAISDNSEEETLSQQAEYSDNLINPESNALYEYSSNAPYAEGSESDSSSALGNDRTETYDLIKEESQISNNDLDIVDQFALDQNNDDLLDTDGSYISTINEDSDATRLPDNDSPHINTSDIIETIIDSNQEILTFNEDQIEKTQIADKESDIDDETHKIDLIEEIQSDASDTDLFLNEDQFDEEGEFDNDEAFINEYTDEASDSAEITTESYADEDSAESDEGDELNAEQRLFFEKYSLTLLNQSEIKVELPAGSSRIKMLSDAQELAIHLFGKFIIKPEILELWKFSSDFNSNSDNPIQVKVKLPSNQTIINGNSADNHVYYNDLNINEVAVAYAAHFIRYGSNLFQGKEVITRDGILAIGSSGLYLKF